MSATNLNLVWKQDYMETRLAEAVAKDGSNINTTPRLELIQSVNMTGNQSPIFDLMVFINLDSRNDRLDFMKLKVSSFPHSVYRWRARNITESIVINSFESNKRKYFEQCTQSRFRDYDLPPKLNSLGAAALYHSWKDFFHFAVKSNITSLFLLEDDVYFISDAWDRIKQLSANHHFIDNSITYMGINQPSSMRTASAKQTIDDAQKSNEYMYTYDTLDAFGGYALAFNRDGILAVHALLQTECPRNVDHMVTITIRRLREMGAHGAKVIMPHIVIPEVRESDNMGPRDIYKLSKARNWNLVDYNYSYFHNFSSFINVSSI